MLNRKPPKIMSHGIVEPWTPAALHPVAERAAEYRHLPPQNPLNAFGALLAMIERNWPSAAAQYLGTPLGKRRPLDKYYAGKLTAEERADFALALAEAKRLPQWRAAA